MSARPNYTADRILLLLLYSPASDWLERFPDGSILVRVGPCARSLKLRSARLFEQLEHLRTAGYLGVVDPSHRWGSVRVTVSRPLVEWPAPGTEPAPRSNLRRSLLTNEPTNQANPNPT